MEHALRFSVIIIFHNQRDFVRTAMESALGQAVDGVEVIAVDDGSTDGTPEVLNDYRERARLILLDENRGACAARDAGTQVATGDYLAYLDGDDAFLPWAIQTYRRVAETHAPALMMGPMRWFEGAVPEPGLIPESISCVRYEDYFAKERVVDVSASAIVVRRRAMESVGGWEGFPVDDLHLLYRLGTAGPFVQITEPSTTLASIAPRTDHPPVRTDHQRRRMADRKRQAWQVSRRGRTTARAARVHRGHRDSLGSDARTVGRSRSCAPIRRQALSVCSCRPCHASSADRQRTRSAADRSTLDVSGGVGSCVVR